MAKPTGVWIKRGSITNCSVILANYKQNQNETYSANLHTVIFVRNLLSIYVCYGGYRSGRAMTIRIRRLKYE